ncbi:MAG: YncE family protein [Candidatus Riflebacteria bacterium]|nr:YncE family protein [Candidatus Riflebacteria bacterium]
MIYLSGRSRARQGDPVTIGRVLLLMAGVACLGCNPPGSVPLSPAPSQTPTPTPTPSVVVFATPQHSSSLALTPGGTALFVANGGVPKVTVMQSGSGTLHKQLDITVGAEPTSIAITPDGQRAYVTNRGTVPGTVTVLHATLRFKLSDIAVGTEPCGCVLSPTGRWLFVANAMSNSISVIDTVAGVVVNTIALPDGAFPFALACTNDGDTDDADEKVLVTQFFGQLGDGERPGQTLGDTDQDRVGKVSVIDVRSGSDATVRATIRLASRDSGFGADRTEFGGGGGRTFCRADRARRPRSGTT